MQPTVYIPTVPMRWDSDNEVQMPVFDLSPLAEWGELKELLRPQIGPIDPFAIAPLRELMDRQLRDCAADDLLVSVGNMALVVQAAALMLKRHGRVNLLLWDKVQKRYSKVEIKA